MLSYTASTRDALMWFQRTHSVEAFGLGGAFWKLTRLPSPGGLVSQDRWLMAAIDHCRMVSNDLLAKRRATKTDEESLREIHDAHRRERVH